MRSPSVGTSKESGEMTVLSVTLPAGPDFSTQ
jgi:hypothetical protein